MLNEYTTKELSELSTSKLPSTTEGPPPVQAIRAQSEEAFAYALYPGDQRWGAALFKRRRRPFLRLNLQELLAVFLPVLAAWALFVVCPRIVGISRLLHSAGRRLAGEKNENEEEQTAIVNACLALEEEFGLMHQSSLPLTAPQKALSGILEFLLGDLQQPPAPESQAPVGTTQAQAPLESELPAPPPLSPQPGPSHSEPFFEWELGADDSFDFGDAATASPGNLSPSQRPETPEFVSAMLAAFPFTPQPSTYNEAPLSQKEYEASADDVHDAADAAATATQEKNLSLSQQFEAPLSVLGQTKGVSGSNQFVLGQTKGVTGSSTSEPPTIPMKRTKTEQQAPKPSPCKKHTSGWKKKSSVQHFPTKRCQPQQPAAGPATKEAGLSRILFLPRQLPEKQILLPKEAMTAPTVSVTSTGFSMSEGSKTKGPLMALLPSGSAPTAVPYILHPGYSSILIVRPSVPPPPVPDFTRKAPIIHLYYRIPVLEAGVVVPVFDAAAAFCKPAVAPKAYACLLNARNLLVREKLKNTEVKYLLDTAAHIIKSLLYANEGPADRRPNKAIRKLGKRYLLMDALISIVQTLGPSMKADQWWPELATRIPSDYVALIKRPNQSVRSFTIEGIAESLSAALRTLKKGIRPSITETLSLKRALFGKTAISEFKEKRWDPWRQDDAHSGGAGGGGTP